MCEARLALVLTNDLLPEQEQTDLVPVRATSSLLQYLLCPPARSTSMQTKNLAQNAELQDFLQDGAITEVLLLDQSKADVAGHAANA